MSSSSSSEQARQIGATLRGRYPVEDLPILTIIDLGGVPRMMHGFARGRIKGGYEEAVRNATAVAGRAGQTIPNDPSELIVMLPDWDGKVTASYGLREVDRQAVAVLVGRDGTIRGRATGAEGGGEILALLDQG
jgi:hypothetical protein